MRHESGGDEGFNSVVSVPWLAERLGRDDLVIADCRFVLADPDAGRRAYEVDHIPGAVYFDLERHLSAPGSGRAGGRHPLPPVEEMSALFSRAGIGDGVSVVCYDDQGGGMAARLWWMLRYLGHPRVALLDGGYAAWRAANLPVSAAEPNPVPRQFVPRPQEHMIATMEDVRRLSAARRGAIIDSRAPERYRGEVEPLDPVAGHIPGAINIPWEGNVDETGAFLAPDLLRKRFERLESRLGECGAGEIVVHCGSGVTGCLNVLALERAGLRGAKLYVGGWSEWCSHPENPVAKGEE